MKGDKESKPVASIPELNWPRKWHDQPWKWHIEETYKGLITISVEVIKMLVLVNGGAAVAVLAYLGNMHSAHAALMMPALRRFCFGIFSVVLAVIFAYLTQLRLYNEERDRHDGKRVKMRHTYLLGIALILAFASAAFFLFGCMVAHQPWGNSTKCFSHRKFQARALA
jgi:hypothetical protein